MIRRKSLYDNMFNFQDIDYMELEKERKLKLLELDKELLLSCISTEKEMLKGDKFLLLSGTATLITIAALYSFSKAKIGIVTTISVSLVTCMCYLIFIQINDSKFEIKKLKDKLRFLEKLIEVEKKRE